MIETSNHITDLIYRSLADELPAGEQAELDDWLDASAKRREWYQALADHGLQEAMQRTGAERIAVVEDIHARIRVATGISSARDGKAQVHRVRFLKTAWVRYAAAVIILFGIGAYLWNNYNNTPKTSTAAITPSSHDILPGGQKAVLTLADGREIILDSAANGAIAQQGNSSITKHNNGEIVYDMKGATSGAVMMNTMRTPRGGQYQVTLPDGSRAWLNAASSITYPAMFVGKERKVKVTGEVYLEVAKNKAKPFIVDVHGKSTVQVLGTSFNVNAYPDEESQQTTLVSGSVKILSNQQAIILQPGEAADVKKDLKVLKNVDVEQVIAWKNGMFYFNNADLRSTMKQLERWYDIKVRYEGEVPSITVEGKMYRNITLSGVLKFLKESGIKTRLEGKTLIVL